MGPLGPCPPGGGKDRKPEAEAGNWEEGKVARREKLRQELGAQVTESCPARKGGRRLAESRVRKQERAEEPCSRSSSRTWGGIPLAEGGNCSSVLLVHRASPRRKRPPLTPPWGQYCLVFDPIQGDIMPFLLPSCSDFYSDS